MWGSYSFRIGITWTWIWIREVGRLL